ncbi:tripartite motif-containing protein 3-like [Ptychodera flava]|uniref:tripartite motif-containing protein 3-like n=1 Tax=Ptychodera flava TaxID=63121 RepID=UPI00396A6802
MAAANSSVGKVLDQIGKDFLSCVICFERYTNPKVLPCLHTYCEQCLLNLVENQGVLNCPTCKAPCPLPLGGVQALESNFFMAGLIEEFQARMKGKLAKCESCEETDAVMRCVECSQYLCQPCVKIHKDTAASGSHQILSIGEFSEQEYPCAPNLTDQLPYCDVHPEKEIKSFCDTCQVPVYIDCTMDNHRIPQHVHRDLHNAADEYLGDLERMLSQLELKEHGARKIRSAFMQARTLLQKRDYETGEQLRSRAKKVMQQVKREEETLADELKKLYDFQLKGVDANISEIEMELELISSTSSYLKRLISNENAALLLSTKQEISRQIRKILFSEPRHPFQPELVLFKPAEGDANCVLGQLASDACPSQCTVENIPKQLMKGETIDLVITTRNSRGKRVITSGKVRVTVKEPAGLSQDVKVHDNRDGTYKLTYRTSMDGTYIITVRINDEPIVDTPLEIPVMKGFAKRLGRKGTEKGEFSDPRGVSINRDGDIVTTDYRNNRLQVLDTDGNCKKVIEYTHFRNPFKPIDVAVSDENHLYYSLDEGNKQVVVSDMDGNLKDCFGQGKLSNPVYIAVHPLTGDVYVVDRVLFSQKIKVFAAMGLM